MVFFLLTWLLQGNLVDLNASVFSVLKLSVRKVQRLPLFSQKLASDFCVFKTVC